MTSNKQFANQSKKWIGKKAWIFFWAVDIQPERRLLSQNESFFILLFWISYYYVREKKSCY